MKPRLTEYIPHSPTPKQAAFLLLPNLEAMFGGAAGGGKSDALLMAALQYVDMPGYAALLLRRTYKDLSLPGALMDRARAWLQPTAARWNDDKKTWTFPSGATLTFGYCESEADVYRYQGAELQFIGVDELTQWAEFQYRYLLSRLRRLAGVTIPIRMRAATNPGGVGHEWVKQRFVAQSPRETGRVFIPAKVADNPHLDQVAYLESLALLDPITRAQLLAGDWTARQEGAIARREWFPIVETPRREIIHRVRAWDFAATEKSNKADDPDWTVGTLMGRGRDRLFYVEHVIRQRVSPGSLRALVRQTAELDGRYTAILFEQEPGSSGKFMASELVAWMAGWPVRALPATGDKVTRGIPFINQAEAGNVKLVRGDWNGEWLDEISAVPISAHDDQWDSAALAFSELTDTSNVSISEY
jgi:predicted phage terminase large subunit-like protein